MARCPVCKLEFAAQQADERCPRCARTGRDLAQDDETAYLPQEAPVAAGAHAAGRHDPTTGTVIAGYRLTERVGDGATSSVYRAIGERDTPPVAVKVLSSRQDGDQEALERFNREAKLARRIKHPNLVRVHDSGQDEATGAHYLVMDLVEGRTLEAIIKEQGPLPWRQALELMYQITQAVAQLHKHGCVHRDIKPSNILIDKGVAKLTDLGFVKPVNEIPNDQDALIMGTPPYMAPEQTIDAREATHAADVYALGATLYHALTGQPPFGKGDTSKILERIRRAEPAPPETLVKGLPRSVCHLVQWSMEKNPRSRPADAATLCLAIERILGNPENMQSIERARLRSWIEQYWLWPLVGALLLAMVLAIFYFTSS